MKSRGDFNNLEQYKDYLLVHFSESFMKSLLTCTPSKPQEYFEKEVDMYEHFATVATRYAKALIDKLKLK